MDSYTTIEGRTVTLIDVAGDVIRFVDRLKAAVEDPAVSPAGMLTLVYGPDNPLLDHSLIPGRSSVTRATLDNPAWPVMVDLMSLKDVRHGRLDPEKAFAAYTVSVPDAAARLGVTQQAVRAAIDGGRLSAVLRSGQWWLRPESVASFEVSNRGRPRKPAAVRCKVGGKPGASLSVRVSPGELRAEGKENGQPVGHFPDGWRRAVVKTTAKAGVRAFELEPAAGAEEAIEHAGLYVRGAFRVVKRHNATPAANAAWRAAAAEKAK